VQNGKIKLLMGIPHPNARGGPPTHLPLLVQYFSEQDGYEIKTFFYGSKEFGTDRGRREGIVRKIFVTSGNIVKYLFYLAAFRPDIVHLNTAFARLAIIRDLPFAILSRIFGVRLIFKIHGSHSAVVHTTNRIQRIMIQLFFWGAAKVGVLSDVERNEIIEQFGHEEELVIVKNIVDFRDPIFDVDLFEKQDDEIYGLFVSRIEYPKGLQDLLRAVPLITDQIPTFRLIIAGDGPDMPNCVELANSLGISYWVTWLGHVDNASLQSLYRRCDFFIFPTHYPEGMPMALVEALKSGIPIITTKVLFAVSYLTDSTNCLFARKYNPGDLAEKVVILFRNRDLQEMMRRENPKFIREFSQVDVGREFEEIYESMLGR